MKHNVILITIDSLRADRLSCLGYHRKATPNLDALADSLVRKAFQDVQLYTWDKRAERILEFMQQALEGTR